jgi:hypothetical protein
MDTFASEIIKYRTVAPFRSIAIIDKKLAKRSE